MPKPGQALQLGLYFLQALVFSAVMGVLRFSRWSFEQDFGERKVPVVPRQNALPHSREMICQPERLVNILERITDAVWALDQQWRFSYINRKGEQILQKNQTDLLGKNIWDVYPEAVGSTFDKKYHEAATTAVPLQFEEFCPYLDIWLEVSVYPSPDGLSIYAQDITARKQAQVALKKAYEELERRVEERTAELRDANARLFEQMIERQRAIDVLHCREQDFQALLDNAPDVIARFDRELRYVYVNSAVERATGLPASHFIGKSNPESGMPDDIYPHWEKTLRQVLATAQEQTLEFNFPTPNGVRTYQSRLVPEFHREQIPQHVLVVSRDITENKRAEEERSQLIREQASRATAEKLERRSAFLAQASTLLASSLDYEVTLSSLARLAVPFLADYCLINRLEDDGQFRQVAAVHRDPHKQALSDEVARLHRAHLQNPKSLVAQVLRTGEPVLVSEASLATAQSIIQDDRVVEIYPQLNPKSFMIVPLVARGQALGTITLAVAESGRRYELADFALAQDLAHRAALSIDNARLYRDAQQAGQRQAELLSLMDALLAAAPVAIGFLDKDLRYIRINQVLASINNLPLEEHLGRRYREVLPEMAERFEPQLQQVLDTGEPMLNVEISGETPGEPGRYGYWLGNYYPIRDANEQTLGIGVILADVTEIKQAEAAAQVANRRVVKILESITDAFFAVDREWRFTYINHRGAQLMRHSPEALLGQCIWEVFPQTVGSIYYEQYHRALQEQIVVHFETFGAYESERWFEIHAYPSADGLAVYFHEVSDRKRAEEALRRSEERFRVAIKNSPIMVYNQDRDLRYTWFHNPHPSYSAEELIGKTDWEIAPYDVATRLTQIKQSVIEGEIGARGEIQIYIDGVLRTYDLTVEPLYSEAGVVTGITGAAVDITERKQAEEALKESEERFRVMFNQAAVGIALVALDGRFIQVNPAMCEITGYSHDELVQTTVQQISHPDEQQLDFENFQKILAREINGYSVEKRFFRKDGSIVWVNVTASAVWDSQGQPKYGVGIIEDISERQAALHEREQAEAKQHFLVEASRILAASLDYETTLNNVAHLAVPTLADWCIVDVFQPDASVRQIAIACTNPSKQEILQELRRRYPPDPVGKNPSWQRLLSGQSIIYPEFTDSQMVATAQNEEHLQLLRSLGRRSVMIVPIQSRQQVLGVLSFVSSESGRRYTQADLDLAEDIARRAAAAIDNARLYQDSEAARQAAQEANRMKDEFLAVLSHELRSPLNAILGWTQILRNRQLNEAAIAKALETIERNAKLQTQLIEDLLDVSRIIRGKLTLKICPVNVICVIEAAINTVRPSADAKSIYLEFIPALGAQFISGDAERLQQVVWNLLSNAIKFTPTGGRVKIKLNCTASEIQIRVMDTGKGISPNFLPHVFDHFRQGDSSTTRSYGGLGLGLAIVRHLVELHRGTVQAQSPGEGQGATFIVTLPLLEGNGKQNTEEEDTGNLSISSPHITKAASPSHPLAGLRILVVDDEADTREYLVTVLQLYGAQVTSVASAGQTICMIEQFLPDVLVSDIAMPGDSGYSLIRQVRALEPHQGAMIPAVAVTAYAREEDFQQAIAAGFQMHISKPVEPAKLVAVVARLAGRVS
jgi:PAS domain S-box-containing protein